METIVKQAYSSPVDQTLPQVSLWRRFMNWCEAQEEHRFGWLATALVAHGCVLTPIALFAIVLSGNAFALWILAIVAMISCLITNLAAMPTKVTIPTFFISIVVDIAIIAYTAWLGYNF